jgi:hypothetical protein
MITYYIRVGCQWVKVTTSRAVWAKLPHVVGNIGCKASPLALAALLGTPLPANPPPRHPVAPLVAPVDSVPSGIPEALLPPTHPPSDIPLGCCVGSSSFYPIPLGPDASLGAAPTLASAAPGSGTSTSPASATTPANGASPGGTGQTQTAVVDEPPAYGLLGAAVLALFVLKRGARMQARRVVGEP